MRPAEPADRRAAAAGIAFVARLIGVVEIRAARPLQQIAGGRRLVAQLAGSAGKERAREQAVVAAHPLIGGKVGIPHQRADPQAAFGGRFDLVELEPVDVNEVCRRLDFELHQVEKIGAAGNEFGAGNACGGRRSFGRRLRALVGESPHAFPPATSVIASTMFE